MPPWVQDGGNEAMLERLRTRRLSSGSRRRCCSRAANWENLYLHAGPEGVLLASLTEPSLKPLIGKTVAEVAKIRGVSPEQAVDRPGPRRPGPLRRHLFPDERGQCPAAGGPSLGQLRLGRRGLGSRGRVPEEQHPSARLWQFRPLPRQICPRRKSRSTGRGRPPADLACRRRISAFATAAC